MNIYKKYTKRKQSFFQKAKFTSYNLFLIINKLISFTYLPNRASSILYVKSKIYTNLFLTYSVITLANLHNLFQIQTINDNGGLK